MQVPGLPRGPRINLTKLQDIRLYGQSSLEFLLSSLLLLSEIVPSPNCVNLLKTGRNFII